MKRCSTIASKSGMAFLLSATLIGATARHLHAAPPAELERAAFEAHLAALTAAPHRLAGTLEGRRAGDHIEAHLRAIGVGEVFTQRFFFPQQVVETCELRTASGTIPLLPLAANGLQPSVTPKDGITGRVVYVGRQRFAVDDVLDWPHFIGMLNGQTHSGPGRRLAAMLPADVQSKLATVAGDHVDAALKRTIATVIDGMVLGNPEFHSPEAWQQVPLHNRTRDLARRAEFGLSLPEQRLFHRLLLEDAFPALISRQGDGKNLSGAIVLADFDGLSDFERYFRLGAAAVIFTRSERDHTELSALRGRTTVTVDLPRFYVSAAASDALLGLESATLVSRVSWKQLEGRNIFLWLPGREPLFKFGSDEYVLLSAPYDTRGIVPWNAPGHEAAANCAALLQTARLLAATPPRRAVLVAFFDNQANFIQGGREFYAALRRAMPERLDDPLPVRRRYIDDEREGINDLLDFYSHPQMLTTPNPRRELALRRLADEAKSRYNFYMETLTDLRIEVHYASNDATSLRDQAAALDPTAENAAELDRLLTRAALLERRHEDLVKQVEPLELDQKHWQMVRESIRDTRPIPVREDTARARQYFQEVIDEVKVQLRNRIGELDYEALTIEDAIALTTPLVNANPVFHVAYRFTAGSSRWLFLPHAADQHLRLYSSLLDQLAPDRAAATRDQFLSFVWESRATWEASNASPTTFVKYLSVEETSLAHIFEIPSITLVTELDSALHAPQPDATFEADALDRIRLHASRFLSLLDAICNSDQVSVPNRIVRQRDITIEAPIWDGRRPTGHAVRSFAYGDTEANRIESNALVHIADASMQTDYVVHADANGHFPLLTVLRTSGSPAANSNWNNLHITSARFDENGRVNAISTAVPGMTIASVNTQWHKASYHRSKLATGYYTVVTMFQGEQGTLLGRSRPFDGGFATAAFTMLQGLSNSAFQRQHFRFDSDRGVGRYVVQRPLGVKVIYRDSRNADDVLLYINANEADDEGIGYGIGNGQEDAEPSPMFNLQDDMAEDMFFLNESRLGRLRRKNIIVNFLEYLHSQSKTLIAEFQTAQAANDHGTASLHAAKIAALERRIYRPVIAITDDMIKAVTVLLILAVPFAFSLQSLLMPTYNVYKKIGGFVLFFALSFAVLYFTHPAFAFSATPAVIILAFIIMLMSGMVIYVVSAKFNYEIKRMQGLAAAAHTMEQRVMGNIGAAIGLAISIMQRRPVRTALTVTTVLLLTFTILSFVAFQAEHGITTFYRGPGEDQTSRLLLRGRVWKTLGGTVEAWETFLRTYHGNRYEVHGCYWRTRGLETVMSDEDLHIPLRNQTSGDVGAAGAMMSLAKAEVNRLADIRRMLPEDTLHRFNAGLGVYLSPTLAGELGLAPGDPITIDGHELLFLGTFDPQGLLNLRHIDGSPFMPVSFGSTRMALGDVETKGSAWGGADSMADLEEAMDQLEPEALEPVSPESLVIVPEALAGKFGMALKGVIIYPREEGENLERLAEQLAVLSYDGVFLNSGGERTKFFYGEKYGMVGVADVAIPLILGGLIVFSTMLGSIIDREKEIYTFSALGLAPKNIAMLFFVEASIYAVVGGFGGYLFSQVVTWILEILATYGLFKAPEMNYSSSTVINTILLVMATVLVSTIYPAVQAARKATAETIRHWHVPPPVGDVLSFDFPFTISKYDITGIICFIREHFANHADRTVGKFATNDVSIFQESEHGMAGMRARIWLQPFDQGISQMFELKARPSDIEEVCDIHVQIRRLSGPPAAWKRSYRLFLTDLRSQFLLWRTLEDAAREHYLTAADDVEAQLGMTSAGSSV